MVVGQTPVQGPESSVGCSVPPAVIGRRRWLGRAGERGRRRRGDSIVIERMGNMPHAGTRINTLLGLVILLPGYAGLTTLNARTSAAEIPGHMRVALHHKKCSYSMAVKSP